MVFIKSRVIKLSFYFFFEGVPAGASVSESTGSAARLEPATGRVKATDGAERVERA